MDKTNYQKMYYELIRLELRWLLNNIDISPEEFAIAKEHIDHNELGLAFEIVEETLTNSTAPEHIQSQMSILSQFLKTS